MKSALFAILLGLLGVGRIEAAVVYVDNTATGSNDGTSWANAFESFQALYNANKPAAGDTVQVSGGPRGSSQTYAAGSSTTYPGQLFFPNNGTSSLPILFEIGQDSAHGGIAIFDLQGGTNWLTQAMQWITISGNAGDGTPHFRIKDDSLSSSGTIAVGANWANIHVTYLNCGQQGLNNYGTIGFEVNPIVSLVEIDHVYLTVDGLDANTFSYFQSPGPATYYGQYALIHDCVIHGIRDSTNNGFGMDFIDSGVGGGISIYNNTFYSYPVVGYGNGQHQDGWQDEGGGDYYLVHDNTFFDIGNYCIFPEPYTGGFSHFRYYNNVCVITYTNTTQAIAVSGTVSYPAVDGVVSNNIADGYSIPFTFRNPTIYPDPGAFINDYFQNNIDVNSTNPNIIDPNVTSLTNLTLTASQGTADFISYAAGSSTNNYTPKSTASAIIGQGTEANSPAIDKSGHGNPNPPPIGPYNWLVAGVIASPGGYAGILLGFVGSGILPF